MKDALDHPVPVDKDGCGQNSDVTEGSCEIDGLAKWITDPMGIGKRADRRNIFIADSDHDQFVVRELFRKLLQVRNLLHAWRTPSGPEVHNHPPSLKVLKTHRTP